jgi:hypothetical protein
MKGKQALVGKPFIFRESGSSNVFQSATTTEIKEEKRETDKEKVTLG